MNFENLKFENTILTLIFPSLSRLELKLEGLEDAYVLEDECNDAMADKHGCPAYVSPEILQVAQPYSGKAADIWSLGVMLYTMLIGRYPFHDVEPSALFGKIRRGQYSIPDTISSKAKCLIRSLLRREPEERLTAGQILQHPWFRGTAGGPPHHRAHHGKGSSEHRQTEFDQTVPDIKFNDDESFFSWWLLVKEKIRIFKFQSLDILMILIYLLIITIDDDIIRD